MAFAKAEALTMVCMKNRFWTLIAAQKFPPPFRFRLAAKTALWWEFLPFPQRNSARFVPEKDFFAPDWEGGIRYDGTGR